MAKKKRLAMVVDACVAQAAGRSGKVGSRKFLRWVLGYCHRFAMNEEIRKEWEYHETDFSRTWRNAMEQKGKILHLGGQDSGPLKNRIRALALRRPSGKRIMEKDAHLIVAAQAADRVIVTLDNEARGLFKEHARQLKTPQGITWRNPEEEPVPWA
jgi:hypothetical protein